MAHLQDRSTATEASFRVRWRDGRVGRERSYTFTSARKPRGASEAEKMAHRLKSYVDIVGHQLSVLEALVGAGFDVEGVESIPVSTRADRPAVVTVAGYAQRWLDALVRPNPRTREDYRKILDTHVLPTLGALDIATLSREQIALWLRAQEISGTGRGIGGGAKTPSLKTIANRHGVLSAMLDDAATDGLRTGNPAKGLGPSPKSAPRTGAYVRLSTCEDRLRRFALAGRRSAPVACPWRAGDAATRQPLARPRSQTVVRARQHAWMFGDLLEWAVCRDWSRR